MKGLLKDNKGYITLVGILLVVVIIGVLYYASANSYFKKPLLDEETHELVEKEGIDTSTYKSLLDSTKEKAKEYEQHMQGAEDRMWDRYRNK